MKTLANVFLLQTLFLAGTTFAEISEATWRLSLRAELPCAQELGFCGAYDVSGSRIHVPVTPLMADAFDAAPRGEVIAFLQLLAVDQTYQQQKGYISICIHALEEGQKPTRSRWKYADGHEMAVVYYHIPFTSLPKKEKKPSQASETTSGLAPGHGSS